jgi:2'-5' RNA ligase
MALTHFLCIPLYTSQQIRESVQLFHTRHQHLSLPHSVIVPPTKLHLTLAVLSLTTQAKLDECRKVLDSFADNLPPNDSGHTAFTMSIRNIHVLRGSPRRARVVYAGVEEVNTITAEIIRKL